MCVRALCAVQEWCGTLTSEVILEMGTALEYGDSSLWIHAVYVSPQQHEETAHYSRLSSIEKKVARGSATPNPQAGDDDAPPPRLRPTRVLACRTPGAREHVPAHRGLTAAGGARPAPHTHTHTALTAHMTHETPRARCSRATRGRRRHGNSSTHTETQCSVTMPLLATKSTRDHTAACRSQAGRDEATFQELPKQQRTQ